MHLSLSIFVLMVVTTARWRLGLYVLASPALQSPLFSSHQPFDDGISEDTYGELERFAKYSSAVYQFICPCPLGNTLVQTVRPSRDSLLFLSSSTIRLWLFFYFISNLVLQCHHAHTRIRCAR
jgi:hypothetical protein